MTTQVSQQSSNPTQASNTTSASQSTPSYASTAKKAVSSPPIATGSSAPSPAVAVGGSAPVQQHGKRNSISPVNGRASVPPAVPAVSAPAIAHSSAAINGSATDHNRKSSVTIPNGGPVGGSKGAIQFGSITDSPAVKHSTPQISHPTSAPMAIPNPRVVSPAQSPSPIPQPNASGGPLPSVVAQGNGVTFGSLGGDGDRHMRQASSTQGPLAPNQPGHLRRESSQSTHSDMSNQGPGAQGRGGFQQGGRGRGGFNGQYQQHQPMGFPPSGPPFRGQPNAGRGGMPPQFQNQGRPMNPSYQGSPHQAARSPALTNSIPNTPNMGQAMPMPNPQQYNQNFYGHQMPNPAVNTPSTLQSNRDSSNPFKGKGKKWMKYEQFSNGHEPEPQSKQLLLGHSLTFMPSNDVGSGHKDTKNLTSRLRKLESEAGLSANKPLYPSPLDRRASLDQSSLPPVPPPLPFIPPPSSPILYSHSPDLAIGSEETPKYNLAPDAGGFEKFLTTHVQQYGFPPQPFDPRVPMQQGGPMMYPQMQNMQYMGQQYPPSPQPGYQQPAAYMQGQYGPQAPSMSRNSSQMSEHRPASSMGGAPSTPSMTPSIAHGHTPQPKGSPAPSATFSRPSRKSAAITIKRPDGGAIDVDSLKAPASPAPKDRARTPPVIASVPTPPPKSSTPLHTRTDSSVVKSKADDEARIQAFKETVKKAAQGTDVGSKAEDEAKSTADAKALGDEDVKAKAKAAEAAQAKEEADAKAAAAKAKQDEEDELERQIQEMEEAERVREEKEKAMLEKRAAEKKITDAAEAEKRKAHAAEEDAKLKEAEREMERLEDERERKKAEAEAKAAGGDKVETESKVESKGTTADEKAAPTTPSTLASKLSNLTLGGESGASTPASDDSMPPPPKVSAAEKRGKPAALKLEPLNTKPVEPPQPSAALQSLKSARFLRVIDSSVYPSNISSPNPALNSAVTTKGKSFKYDKEFLLQFQKVFIEKPSMEFESQIKALIGDPSDGGSARSASARPGSGMGPRGSNRNAPGAFAMGSFGAGGIAAKPLPPGTTSAERFAMSQGSMPRPPINGPMASFNRPGGAFPGGNTMARTPSNSTMGSMPHSPRQQSRSQRGGSKREYQGNNSKQEAQAAKTMPLTAGMELKPIQVSATGWKPRSIGASQSATGAAGPAPGASGVAGHMEPDMVQRKVKAALNKMTPEKFDKIADQILTIAAQSKDEADGRTLRQVIQLTFEKATDEAHWAGMYAKFCKRMLETMSPEIKDESILDKNGNIVSGGNLFRKYLLNRCQEEFERGWKMDLPDKPEGERGEEKTEEAVMLSDEYYIAAAAKRRGLGLVQFIGELYKLTMLTERIMHECVKKLVDYTGIPDEAEIESLTKLLKTIGSNLDSTEKGKPMMDVYFSRIQGMIDQPDLPSRLKFMLMDIVDLRKKRWQSKEDNKGPKTLEQVRAEAEAAAEKKAAENNRGNQRGGGRMPMGRGDTRNFGGNQFGNQPPVDYARNTVATDDLRRLTKQGQANRQTSASMNFGPTSMFSSRSNSGRKMGPGGSLSRTGDDSGASSRTGTPPQQKEKESISSVNAFNLLASLGSGSGEAENPASPPSASNSPELSKATPAAAAKTEDKIESES